MSESSTSPSADLSIAPSSSSSSVVSLQSESTYSNGTCPVCLCEADHAHFGGIKSCNSCAAFFRRTIVLKKAYKCRNNKNCTVKKDKHQRGCQSCRFKKCLQIGMTSDAVQSKPVKAVAENDGSLSFLLKCRKSNFSVRAQETLKTYNGNYINMSNQLKSANSCILALKAENVVLLQFIKTLNLTQDPKFMRELVMNFMPFWVASESLLSTIRHRGFTSKRSYYLDDSYLNYNEDWCVSYYKQYKTLMDPYLVARSGFKLYTSIVQTSEKIYQSRISEAEYTAIQVVLLLQTAIRLQPGNPIFRQHLNRLFIELQKYMSENFEDIALRMDSLINNLQLIQNVKAAQDEAFLMQYLDDRNGDFELQITPFIR
ncbi:hypothetical protein M3Y97_00518900 [Aphelenchoides bicaudatus]|nr:hypothetical protein M3Y97_00518900 [Aphelenchoides bicaudatus]